MDLKKHIIDTIKEWQLKIGYREGNMKLYYPGESLVMMLNIRDESPEEKDHEGKTGTMSGNGAIKVQLERRLAQFCEEVAPQLGRIQVGGDYERYCLEISAKGCAYVAGKVEEPEFLKRFLNVVTGSGNNMEQIRECFASYARDKGTSYVEEEVEEDVGDEKKNVTEHSHSGHAFYFADAEVEEYVYWVEENEFGLTYHRFTRVEYEALK